MKIEKLTPEQEKLIPIVRDEWINFCLGGDTKIDKEKTIEGLKWIYEMKGLPIPKFIAFAEGPLSAQCIAQIFPSVCKAIKMPLNRASVRASVGDSVWDSVKKIEYPLWTSADSGWISFYDFFMRCNLKHEVFEKYRDWVKAGHWEVLLFRDLSVVVCRPLNIKKDERGRLHCANGAAVEWPSGEKYWFWHGTRGTEKMIMRPNELTKDEIINEKNSEVSRVIAEKLGWDEYMRRIGTVLINKWFDCSTSCHYELYDFKDRMFSLMPRLLKMESPELKDGTRPCYIEPVHPELKTCEQARRWQFCLENGDWPTVDYCIKNPTLEFSEEA